MGIAWRSVGAIVQRVVADGRPAHDPFAGLVRIGIDEISYKKGHRYLTVVVDHDSGRLVWAAVGRDKKTLESVFGLLGEERCKQVKIVTADGATWIADVVKSRCKNATLCIDAFHVCQWASEALDEVRREVWNQARSKGMRADAKELKDCRFALWKNPEDLTVRQEAKLSWIAKENAALYRAYLLEEQLGLAIRTKGIVSLTMLDTWARLGCLVRHPRLRRTGKEGTPPPSGHRGRRDEQHERRIGRVHEHEAPRPAPDGLWVP